MLGPKTPKISRKDSSFSSSCLIGKEQGVSCSHCHHSALVKEQQIENKNILGVLLKRG